MGSKPKDMIKLIVVLAFLAVGFYAAHLGLKGYDNTKKYTHPISRSGAGW